jgi:Sialidase-like, CBM domain
MPATPRLGWSAAAALVLAAGAAARPPVPPPVRFAGTVAVTATADGGLRPVVGVQNIEVLRSNRTHPELADGLPDTYRHQPMLAWWHGRFYLEYLSGPRDEGQAPCVTSLTSSADGVHWDPPRVAFPAFRLPDGTETVTHQRMGFYVAPDGRLLVLAFQGKAPHPNDGTGIGREVREIRADGSLGPIYFIFYNRSQGWNETNTPYPCYRTSPDAGFVAACDALLADKLMTQQWWEESRFEKGFFATVGRAFCFYHRQDGAVVGLWKDAQTALSTDGGHTWTKAQFGENLPVNASKYWGQRTPDGRYALFLNPTNRLRFPLAVMTGDDGTTFHDLLAVHGEVPDQRFAGAFKNLGPQYVRGIAEGNGTPPGDAVWVAYSVNKEDIWVSRVPVPIRGRVDRPVHDTFDADPVGSLPAGWNVYSPLWAPVRVVAAGGTEPANHALELRDEDPDDYARAVRVFPETHGLTASFKVLARQTDARLEIELLDAHGARPVRLAFAEDGHLWACHEGIWEDAGPYAANRWITLGLQIAPNPKSDHAILTVDGRPPLPRNLVFTEPAASVERLSFRTGKYRRRGYGGRDLPGADDQVPAASFLVDDVTITPMN